MARTKGQTSTYISGAKGIQLGAIDLLGAPESVHEARAFVRRILGMDHPVRDDVTLLVSEAVTNSVLHSDSTNGGRVRLALADCGAFIYAEIADAGGRTAPRVPRSPVAEGGRGMVLVDAIARRWGVEEHEAGRTLWFEVPYACEGHDVAAWFPRQRRPADPVHPVDQQ
ncbi:ATP-binding protein [Sphaerisporangium krabiense]|uniref:Anti-sigma regulatory factor (Ser/Thr protein kinase) n=1 Tax=Sphaerisporangium krabiense TaxID=763782 RepID=A0A7W9DSY4_9ACTN|nr:ATP-binding protein [Sphaerisporangium krabiense]MBB5630217.1 anti-sigma regulatory factor (Ser/Thr protein kinase) [Sphaerisporangium krabiense]GII62832.1 ATP-binding protein [Sphaerisporangium krabiense]